MFALQVDLVDLASYTLDLYADRFQVKISSAHAHISL